MILFLEICHGKCYLRYVGGRLELRKLDFRGLIIQFNVKKANFRELVAKTGHYRPILASRTHLWFIFMEYVMENLI